MDRAQLHRLIVFGTPLVLGVLEVGHPALLPADGIMASIVPIAGSAHNHESKFYKTRLVPIGPDLARFVASYATWRHSQAAQDSPFFIFRRGQPVHGAVLNGLFAGPQSVQVQARSRSPPPPAAAP
jgi:hypothetical protein